MTKQSVNPILKTAADFISVFGFFFMLLFLLYRGHYAPGITSDVDNRKLKDLPQPLTYETLRTNLEDFLSDRIGGRRRIISMYQNVLYHGFQTLVHPLYQKGEDGYVFSRGISQYQRLNTDTLFLNESAEYIASLENYLRSRNIAFLYFLAPFKDRVYEDKYSSWIHQKNAPHYIDVFVNALKMRHVTLLYPLEEFISARRQRQVYNRQYDANHWNEYGAFLGHSLINQKLREKFPSIEPLREDNFSEGQVLRKYFPVSDLIVNETVPLYTPKNSQAKAITLSNVDISFENSVPLYYINKSLPLAPRILVFGASYFGFQNGIKYYIDNFSEAALVYSYPNLKNIEYYVNVFEPDIVLLANAEYVINTSYHLQPARVKETILTDWSLLSSIEKNEEPLFYEGIRRPNGEKRITTTLSGRLLNHEGLPGTSLFIQIGTALFPARYSHDGNEAGTFSLTIQTRSLDNISSVKLILIDIDEKKLKPFTWHLPPETP